MIWSRIPELLQMHEFMGLFLFNKNNPYKIRRKQKILVYIYLNIIARDYVSTEKK